MTNAAETGVDATTAARQLTGTSLVRITDRTGRVLGVRRPGVVQRLRLFEAVGAENALNPLYMSFALLAVAVVECDGEICEPVATRRQLEARLQLLDEHGLDAVNALFTEPAPEAAAGA